MAGSGIWWSGAAAELRALAERGIPVVTRQQARGTIPDDHPMCFGRDWQSVVFQADALLVVGKQLDYFFGYGNFPHLDAFVQVDINPAELGRNRIPVTVGLLGDAARRCRAITEKLPPLATDEWVTTLRAQADELAAGRRALAGVGRGADPPDATLHRGREPAPPRRDRHR